MESQGPPRPACLNHELDAALQLARGAHTRHAREVDLGAGRHHAVRAAAFNVARRSQSGNQPQQARPWGAPNEPSFLDFYGQVSELLSPPWLSSAQASLSCPAARPPWSSACTGTQCPPAAGQTPPSAAERYMSGGSCAAGGVGQRVGRCGAGARMQRNECVTH